VPCKSGVTTQYRRARNPLRAFPSIFFSPKGEDLKYDAQVTPHLSGKR